jgi:hypothetical protein
MIDLDWLKLVDMTKVTLEPDGTVKGADELMTALKEAKPYLFGKHARDMTNARAASRTTIGGNGGRRRDNGLHCLVVG